MNSRGILFLLFAILSHVSVAQRYIPAPEGSTEKKIVHSLPASGNLRVLAIMVQFQRDNDRTTVGNGQFDSIYTRDWGTRILDPLPHDSAYFSAHLEFAKNYYSKVSRGSLSLQYTVLPEVITLSKTMREYSPPIRSTDFTPMVNFYEESWQKADELYPGFDFSAYDVFCIFHAGVGRDVSLPGSLNNERDLPSVYFNLESFRKYKGAGYNGVPVSSGSFTIKNSMILPQTQNREIESFGNYFLIELTINGLIVSSVASHLGLPDLFDTKTGLSAIGRFGLMDGQSIFAYNGVFPPNPSAWERIQLGWDSAIPLGLAAYGQSTQHNLTAVSASSPADTTIYKISLTADEHYLIENRLKDSGNNGITFTIWNNGSVYQRSFTKDTSFFNSFTVDSLEGVIINVDDFDWALPGSGILVWHIDEKVIRENIAANQVNTDKLRRGVDLEEADGIQDIGEQFTTIFGDVLVGEGDELDLWYSTNEADLYKNEFSDVTRPDTRSNAGAFSQIRFFDFSAISKNASFRLGIKSEQIQPVSAVNNYPRNLSNIRYFDIAGYKGSIEEFDSVVIASVSTAFSINKGPRKAAYYADGNDLIMIDAGDSAITQSVISAGSYLQNTYKPGFIISSEPVVAGNKIYIGSSTGTLHVFTMDKTGSVVTVSNSALTNGEIRKIFPFPNRTFTTVYNGSLYMVFAGNTEVYSGSSEIKSLYVTELADGKAEVYLTSAADEVIVIELTGTTFSEKGRLSAYREAAFGTNRSSTEAVIFSRSENKLNAGNVFNISSENFPVNFAGEIISNIVTAQNSAGEDIIFSATADGLINGSLLSNGKQAPGFPLPFANGDSVTLMLRKDGSKTALIAHSNNGSFSRWNLSGIADNILWSGDQGSDGEFSAAILNAKNFTGNRLLDETKTYNYPNPVNEGSTQIRFFVNEDAAVTVRIFDLAGDLAAELKTAAAGGFDQELNWNVSDIQSGVYFARVEAVTVSGKKDFKIIKIAVVK